MINLFNIPNYKINTKKFSNLLHDKIVTEFENNFCQYVNGKYAVSFNSATSAIFLLFTILKRKGVITKPVSIPSILPPVVANAILNAGCDIEFNDNSTWVGRTYHFESLTNFAFIVDSAQAVGEIANTIKNYIVIYSFYPTKPVGSCDGGMIVTDNKDIADELRILSFNGMNYAENNWDRQIQTIGHKMYMNSIQAYIANKNLKKLDMKKRVLAAIRDVYNNSFNLNRTSDHLYRVDVSKSDDFMKRTLKIEVNNYDEFVKKASEKGIQCGIHYKPLHLIEPYKSIAKQPENTPFFKYKMLETLNCVSIPFHERLTQTEVDKVIEFVIKNQNKH